MQVLMVTHEYPPNLVGGLGTHSQELARGLAGRGIRVAVLSFSLEGESSYNDAGVQVHFLKFPLPGRKHQYDGGVQDIAVLAQEVATYILKLPFVPDIIHVHEWLGYMLSIPLIRSTGRPVILTMHALWSELVERWSHHPEGPAIREFESRACHGADRVIAVSQALANGIHDKYRVPVTSISVVHNGFNGAAFTDLPASTSEASEWHLAAEAGLRLIVYAGRITSQKGVLELIKSAGAVARRNPDVMYVIAGRQESLPYMEAIHRVVREDHFIAERVIFTGKLERPQLLDLYRHATMAVVPSLYEPFGYAATEAMVAGIPVVATAVDGLEEIIEHEISGLLVPLDNPASREGSVRDISRLAEAQSRILENRLLAEELASNGRTRAMTAFSLLKMVDGTVAIYHATVDPKSDRAVIDTEATR